MILDTALVLQAFKSVDYSDQTIISSVLGFLLSTQNPDGGWGFYPSTCSGCNDPDLSNVYMTSLVVNTLSQYKSIYNLQSQIDSGVAYLLTKQNTDGGFGTSPSTVYETALAYLALIESGQGQAQPLQNAINYLTSTQPPNGSWNDDPYSTALALRALGNVKPNLSILPGGIAFSNPNPRSGDTITITARVYNEGPANADNVVVQFYDGDPSSTGILIGEVTIPAISAFGNSQANMNWTVPTASLRKVFVRIDPLNSIDELDETDNMAFRNLTSSTLPDLTIGSADITFSPDPVRIGDPVTITVTVRNHGQSAAENFLVYVYVGDPDQGGSTIAQANYSYLEGGGTNSFQFIWTLIQGVDRITVKIDPSGQVAESNENNNQAYRLLATIAPPVEGIDLVAVPNSLSFSPGIGQVGQPVTITSAVLDNGTIGASNISVDFFDAGSSGPIQKIYSTVIPFLGPGQKQTISFQYSFTKGSHTVCMRVDPQNLIQEANENNNELCAGLTVIEGTIEDTLAIPRNLSGTSTRNSITIRWGHVTRQDLAGYFVYREGIQQNTIPIQQDNYTDSGLPSGTLYHYKVSSVDILGIESSKSEILAISTTLYDIDLQVDYKDITISPEDAQAGQTITIRAKIHNLGTDPMSNVTVNIYTLEVQIGTFYVPSIAAGGEYLVQTTWVVTDPNDLIYVEADPDNLHLEKDEFNNLAIASIVSNVRFTRFNQVISTTYRAMGDLDNDGDLDVLNVNGSILLINDGNGNFTYLTNDKTGLNYGRDYSGAFGDIDNDGDLDIFLCSTWGDNRLFRNNGNLTFTDITQQAGLKGINTYTVNAVFGDLNNDGKLDLYVGGYGGDHYIYLNNGNGTFNRVLPTISEGYQNVELGDIDGDGDLDTVVNNGNAVIYKNDGTGHFTRHQALPGSYWDSALGDIDNDGHLDIVTLNPGRVFYNDGYGNFSFSNSVALPRSGVYTISLADFDNDGDLDILYSDYGYLIRNDGNRKFTDITPLNQLIMPWYTVLLGDLDNDGDIDIVGGQYIYKNQMNNNNYLIFSLRGIESNYYGIGSKIRVYEEGHLGEKNYFKGFRQVQAGGHGYVSMDSSDAHFGLNSDYLYDIQVEFPASGIIVNRRSASTGRKLILPEYGDLYVNTEGITFSPEAPLDGDNLIVTAVIHNPTAIDVDNVVVGFYDGNPTAGGMELGRVELPYVPAEGEKAFPIQIVLSEGTHEIYVVIDPDKVLRETNKANNSASKTVDVVPRIVDQDLSISASDIGVSPVAPWEGAEVTLSAVVHSSGTRDVQNVPVVFYDGDPAQGGILIGGTIIPTILASGDAQTQVRWNTLGKPGLHYIHVVVDPKNLIREVNESNNSAFIAAEVMAPAKPDLAITASDIVFSSPNPKEGDLLTINTTVRNLGTATSAVEVFLYDGDPSQGGIVLSQKTIPQIIPLGGTAVLNFDVNTVGLAGGHNFFITIDPNNRIDEMIESNNIASSSLAIGSSNLNLSLSTDKTVYTANENVQITVNIYNLINSNRSGTLEVKILDGNNNLVAVISGQGLTLGPNENRTPTYTWNTGQTLSGSYKVSCQFSKSGNVISRAEVPITIAPVKNISSRVAADKISYKATQAVTITSTVTSLSPNYIFSNLNARIRIANSQAATLLTDSKTIPLLNPNQLSALKTYWNTSTNPAGIYMVTLEVFEGLILLSTSTTSFEILRTQDTGEGLKGTLTAQPNPVNQGGNETSIYNITNQGNEDAANLSVKVLIVNPETQEIKQTFETTANLSMGKSLEGNFIFSTINLTPRTYLAILQVSSVTMAQPKTLASATFEIIQNQCTLIATAGPNGMISPSGTITVNYGESRVFAITPNAGYHVAEVKVDGASVGAMTTFTFDNVTSNHTIEATFEINNSPPVADAGQDQNVMTGPAVTLNGSESFDPEGAMITFLWAFVEVPAGSSVTDASLSDVTSAKPTFTPDVNGVYRLQLIVNDGVLDSVADEVLINATTPNVMPNANAGPDQNVLTGDTVQLDGSRSSDPDNGPLPLGYLWSFAAKPAGSLLNDNYIVNRNMPNATFTPDVDGLYELRLTINDGHLSSEDMVKIMATIPNVLPNANAGADMTVYLGDMAALDGSASNDPDHGPQPLAYLWSFVAVPTGSQLTNGHISGANTASPSFTPDVVGTYVMQLMVFDGKDAGFDNVAVTVIRNQSPNSAPTGDGVYEVNTPVILGGKVSDADGDLLTYEWLEGDRVLFSGQIKTTYGGGPVNLPEQTVYLGLGTHVISLNVNDGVNPPVRRDLNIKVVDTTPPTLDPVADKTTLWPPNHKMVDITIRANAKDNIGGPVRLEAVVTSNEPQNGLGDGDTSPDWTNPVIDQINGIIRLQLRSERSGAGNGRIYTITITGKDYSGNSSKAEVQIRVPHDQGQK